ncbi:MAG: PD-(D/E)XK nuclease family protein [Desulfamplus sp.]
MDKETLSNTERALSHFSVKKMEILEQATNVLKKFQTDEIAYAFKKYQNWNLNVAIKVLDQFKEKKLYRFDIFRLAGFVANETMFSNAIAAIIDPNRPHQLGKKPLLSILKTIKHRDDQKIDSIMAAIQNSDCIQVIRELHLGITIPDIVVESDKFIIFIENKIRGGKETYCNGSYQSDRQWGELQKRGRSLGIPENCILGIYLTPEGKSPISNEFVRLSVWEFVDSIREIISTEDNQNNRMIETFMDFYTLSV